MGLEVGFMVRDRDDAVTGGEGGGGDDMTELGLCRKKEPGGVVGGGSVGF